jgi:hypothetical protein
MDDLMALTSLAGRMVVATAATDAWQTCKRRFARLLGHGDPAQIQLAEQRLEQTREQLAGAEGADLERVGVALEAQWATRLADLLQDDPAAETDLRALVQQIQAQLPAGMVSAADHAIATGRDVLQPARPTAGSPPG